MPALPTAALDHVEAIWFTLDDAAERLLAVTHTANELITASLEGKDLIGPRAQRDALVESMLMRLREAVAHWEWLVGAADV